MTVKKLLKRLEVIKDSLSDSTNRYEIEGTIDDIALLMDDVDSFGVDEDDLNENKINYGRRLDDKIREQFNRESG